MTEIELTALSDTGQADSLLSDLNRGAVFIYPTDTLYGIGGNFFSHQLIERIDNIKGRGDKPYSVAVSDIEMLTGLVKRVPDLFYQKFAELLPGKYTFLFEAADHIDGRLLKGSSKIGIRIPDMPPLLTLIARFGKPIVTTSVNSSGEAPLNSASAIRDFIQRNRLIGEIDYLIDGGDLKKSGGSTIVDLTGAEPSYIVR